MMVRLGWQRGMTVHNALIAAADILLAFSVLVGLPFRLAWPAFLSLPASELPQTVNPKNGFVVNANNDTSGATLDNNPLNQLRVGGQGIYFLGYSFDFGTRAIVTPS